MRVFINSSILRSQRTGIGTYVLELTQALQKLSDVELSFFDGRYISTRLDTDDSSIAHKRTNWIRNIPGAYQARRLLDQRRFNRAIRQMPPTLYHDPSLWPLQFTGPMVMTVHDLTHINFAWTQPQARVREIKRELPSALERAARILVDSQFIADELQEYYSVAKNKIVVAPLAHSKEFAPRRENQIAATLQHHELHYRHYFLLVGTLEPRKNLYLALKAHANLAPALRQLFPLLIVGGSGWMSNDIASEINEAARSGFVRKLGYIDRDDLADILAGARAFIFPSLYEGFGLPILEAMASGTPVLSSNAASLPEVGGAAARYFDPYDQEALTQLMREIIENDTEWQRLSAEGIERAKLFSWERCAELTVQTYRAAIDDY